MDVVNGLTAFYVGLFIVAGLVHSVIFFIVWVRGLTEKIHGWFANWALVMVPWVVGIMAALAAPFLFNESWRLITAQTIVVLGVFFVGATVAWMQLRLIIMAERRHQAEIAARMPASYPLPR
jgi:uncharacterized membrane protein